MMTFKWIMVILIIIPQSAINTHTNSTFVQVNVDFRVAHGSRRGFTGDRVSGAVAHRHFTLVRDWGYVVDKVNGPVGVNQLVLPLSTKFNIPNIILIKILPSMSHIIRH